MELLLLEKFIKIERSEQILLSLNEEQRELVRDIKDKKFTWELFGKTTVGGSSAYNLTLLEITS